MLSLAKTLTALLAASALAAQAASVSPAAVAEDFVAAWNSHDARNFAPLLTEDAWWMPVVETRLVGRDRIVADLQHAHAIWAGHTTLTTSDVVVTALGEKAAVVLFNAPFVGNDGRPTNPPNVLMLAVVESAEGWRIRAGQLAKPGQTVRPAGGERQ